MPTMRRAWCHRSLQNPPPAVESKPASPGVVIYDDFEGQLFKNHALGRNILGSIETVEKFSRKDIFRFIKKNYNTNEMVLSSVGDIDFKKLVSLAEKYFGIIPASEKEIINALVAAYSAI